MACQPAQRRATARRRVESHTTTSLFQDGPSSGRHGNGKPRASGRVAARCAGGPRSLADSGSRTRVTKQKPCTNSIPQPTKTPPKIHLPKCHIVTAIFYCGGVFWLSKYPKIVSIIPKTGPPRRKMSKIWGFEESKEMRQKSGKS
jgi:hypothetical protein